MFRSMQKSSLMFNWISTKCETFMNPIIVNSEILIIFNARSVSVSIE